jgi:MFS family permease
LSRRIQDRNIWVIDAAILILGIAYGTSIAVLAIHLAAHHIPKPAMGALSAAFAIGIAGASLPAGWVVRRVGPKRTMVASLLGYGACVAAFPFLSTVPALSAVRFFDGAFSAGIWVAAETALLARSDRTNKAFVMSLYAGALAVGYVLGPLLSRLVVPSLGTSAAFVMAAVLAAAAAMVIVTQLEDSRGTEEVDAAGGSGRSIWRILWRIKTSCLATFAYGYFQASVVLFLPLYLIESKGVPDEQTILVTAFFALGMLASITSVGRLGDRFGHLVVMRVLGTIGGIMVASFVLLSSFYVMCVAVFIAGATLASISPVSLALQGIITPEPDFPRANGLYNAAYALGMLLGPSLSGLLMTRLGGGAMLMHLAGLWAFFVAFTVLFARDDPKLRSPV